MYEYYLKAPNKRIMMIFLEEAKLLENDDVLIDYVDTIPGVSGYHVNMLMARELTTEEQLTLDSILIEKPTTPLRKWWI